MVPAVPSRRTPTRMARAPPTARRAARTARATARRSPMSTGVDDLTAPEDLLSGERRAATGATTSPSGSIAHDVFRPKKNSAAVPRQHGTVRHVVLESNGGCGYERRRAACSTEEKRATAQFFSIQDSAMHAAAPAVRVHPRRLAALFCRALGDSQALGPPGRHVPPRRQLGRSASVDPPPPPGTRRCRARATECGSCTLRVGVERPARWPAPPPPPGPGAAALVRWLSSACAVGDEAREESDEGASGLDTVSRGGRVARRA